MVGVICRLNRDISQPVIKFAEAGGFITLQLIRGIIWMTPLGVLSLLLKALLEPNSQVVGLLESLVFYTLTATLGLSMLAFIIIPLFYLLLTFQNPFPLFKDFGDALIYAIAPASR